MRWLTFTTLFLALTLTAGEFEDAEKLFQLGKFLECDELIGKTLESNISEAQKLKLQAMREYILGNNLDKIAENVKKAQEIANHRGWLTADLLNHSTLLIRRAEDWKARGVPEYQELSDAATKLLAQIKDGGNSEIAIKQVLLQTKNFNLNGEYQEPIQLIRKTLQHYYPIKHGSRAKKPSGEIMLLILLGEQYAGLGFRIVNEREKISAISDATKYYLAAATQLPNNSPQFQDLCNRLHYCRETLRLLGFDLRLPSRIKQQSSVAVSIIDEMLKTRRYHDVVVALENNTTPEMRIRFALALTAIGQSKQAVKVIGGMDITEPHFLLLMAGNALSGNEKTEAAKFFRCFLELAPDSLDALRAANQYVAILIEQKNYAEGAEGFIRLSELSVDAKSKETYLFHAAQ
ncbi:MAG: hypothetical protein JXR78_15535, partial [Victivallales bacterium]|nr:hypothetical protein [Victivallales bacterium]